MGGMPLTDDTSVVFLATGWGPVAGGINSVNYDLCRVLAPLTSARIVCVAANITRALVSESAACGVRLLPLPDAIPTDRHLPTSCARDIVAAVLPDLTARTWWIGHDLWTGEVAIAARHLVQGSHCALIVHTSPLDYEVFKDLDGKRAHSRDRTQKDLLSRADVVFGIGPRLASVAVDALTVRAPAASGVPSVVSLVPGLPVVTPVVAVTGAYRALVFGRFDARSESIKQGRLAVSAFGRAVALRRESLGDNVSMTVLGLPENEQARRTTTAELSSLLATHAGWPVPLIGLPYTTDRESLFETIRGHSLVLVLSRHEGFGLTAWEAIAAGVPLVLSKRTGVHDLLRAIGGPALGCVAAVALSGNDADIDEVALAIIALASDRSRAKRDALALRDQLLREGYTWTRTGEALASALGLSQRLAARAVACGARVLASCTSSHGGRTLKGSHFALLDFARRATGLRWSGDSWRYRFRVGGRWISVSRRAIESRLLFLQAAGLLTVGQGQLLDDYSLDLNLTADGTRVVDYAEKALPEHWRTGQRIEGWSVDLLDEESEQEPRPRAQNSGTDRS